VLQGVPGEEFGVVGAIVEHLRQAGVHDRQVVALEEVVHVDLPVAAHLVCIAPRVAHRAEVDRRDALGDAAVHTVEIRRVIGKRHEHQALPLRQAQSRQVQILDAEISGVLHFRCRDQLALLVVQPAVVAATQRMQSLAAAMRQRPGAMAADVDEGAQLTVPAPQHQHRRARHLLDHMIAGLGQLPLVRYQLPTAAKDAASLEREHVVTEIVARVERVGLCQRHGLRSHRRAVHCRSSIR
jgi:hypothetical protein